MINNINIGSMLMDKEHTPKIEIEDSLDDILKKEKQGWLEKLFDMYPALESDKKNIEKRLKKKTYKSEEAVNATYTNQKEIVLDKIQIGDAIYYTDHRKVLWDSDAKICGIINKKESETQYIIFDANLDLTDEE
jgi:mRNA-degrading endonuclease HigB of HigAB toxin-antitoxin module